MIRITLISILYLIVYNKHEITLILIIYFIKVKINSTLQTTGQYPSWQLSVKFMKMFFIVDSMTISPQIIYYHPHNLAFDQEQALNMLF